MNMLHLEDDLEWFSRVIKPALDKLDNITVFHASHKQEALEIIDSHDIDFAMLDLSVPIDTPNGAPEVEHGLSVAWHIRTNYPGIPILILTGQSTDEAAEKFEEENTFTYFWDGKEKPLVKLRKKRQLRDVLDYLASISELLKNLDNIEIDYDKRKLNLHKLDKRVLQLFCKKNGAVGAKITPLSEGLSSAKVLYVQLINEFGTPFNYTLAKIDYHHKVDLEKTNFKNFITKLSVGCFPSYLDEYYAGCKNRKGVFFQFAVHFNNDYFDAYSNGDQNALEIVKAMKNILTNWIALKTPMKLSVGDIRRYLCSDEKFKDFAIANQFPELNINEFESKSLRSNISIQHADLHGMNILISDKYAPIIIDYGDVKLCSSVIDPITLELSHYFHPKMNDKVEHNLELASQWFNDDVINILNSHPETAIFLRKWSRENSFFSSEYTAGVYAYAVRQLTYGETDKDFAKQLIIAAVNEFD